MQRAYSHQQIRLVTFICFTRKELYGAFHFNWHCFYFFSCRSIKKNSFNQIKMLLKKSCQRLSETLQICSCWWNANSAREHTELCPSAINACSNLKFDGLGKDPMQWRNESMNCSHKLYECKSSNQASFSSRKSKHAHYVELTIVTDV